MKPTFSSYFDLTRRRTHGNHSLTVARCLAGTWEDRRV